MISSTTNTLAISQGSRFTLGVGVVIVNDPCYALPAIRDLGPVGVVECGWCANR